MKRNNLLCIQLFRTDSINKSYIIRKTKCRHLEIAVFYQHLRITSWRRITLKEIEKLPLMNVSRETLFKKQLYKDLQKGGYNGK